MCRMVGVLSLKPINPSEYLIGAPCSLLTQAEMGFQGDGWGIGYYENKCLKVFKSFKPVYEEKELFSKVCGSLRTNLFIAHVRKASNPRGLPREKLIGLENTQPFRHNNLLFAHNGSIKALNVVEKLGEYKQLIRGVNDSEIYFVLFLKYWNLYQPNILKIIRSIEKDLQDSVKEGEKPYSSLNAIFSDGEKLYAVNRYIEGKNLKSLCYKDSEYFRMVYRYNGSSMVIASEKLDNKCEWRSLSDGEILIAEVTKDKIEYRILRL